MHVTRAEEARELARLFAGVKVRLSVIDVNDPTGRFVVESELPGVSTEFDGRHRLVARIPGGRATVRSTP